MAELVYFNGRGYAEIARILLTYGEVEYMETDLTTREEYMDLLPELTFGQVPLLRIDGLKLVQSRAIVHYLARKLHLDGDNEQDKSNVDMLYEGSRDFQMAFMTVGYTKPDEELLPEIQTKTLSKYLPIFDKILSEGKTGYLVGNRVSLADLGLLECLLATVDYFGEQAFNDYPHIQAFYKTLVADAKIKKYVAHVRKPKNHQELLTMVRKILSHLNI